MFREVRRKDRLATEEDCLRILEEAEYGILATQGEDHIHMPYQLILFLDGKNICIVRDRGATNSIT